MLSDLREASFAPGLHKHRFQGLQFPGKVVGLWGRGCHTKQALAQQSPRDQWGTYLPEVQALFQDWVGREEDQKPVGDHAGNVACGGHPLGGERESGGRVSLVSQALAKRARLAQGVSPSAFPREDKHSSVNLQEEHQCWMVLSPPRTLPAPWAALHTFMGALPGPMRCLPSEILPHPLAHSPIPNKLPPALTYPPCPPPTAFRTLSSAGLRLDPWG